MTAPTSESSEIDPIDRIVEDYAEHYRAGDHPSIETYTQRYPEFAEELRRLLPTVAFLERGKHSGAGLESSSRLKSLVESATEPANRMGENRLVRELGRGGMGIVYEAIQEPLGRRVAVKVLLRHSRGTETSRKRFLREIQIVAALDHPGIVPIHMAGEHDGVPYYVMTLIEGVGLDRLLATPSKRVPSDLVERARWACLLILQATEALDYAHRRFVLHRDIKPANLLLDENGKLWLADFGLAKLADDLSLTGSGELPGTLRYLAPECLHGEADARSDIYSLGLTLYELLLGLPAFPEANWAKLLQQVGAHQPPSPRKLQPGLPADVELIVLRAMAREPADRYPTAGAFADDLNRFLRGEPIDPERRSSLDRLVRWTLKNPVVSLLAATSTILAFLTIYFGLHWLFAPPPRDPLGPRYPEMEAPLDSPQPKARPWREGAPKKFAPPPPPVR